jgi:hypothetical protein
MRYRPGSEWIVGKEEVIRFADHTEAIAISRRDRFRKARRPRSATTKGAGVFVGRKNCDSSFIGELLSQDIISRPTALGLFCDQIRHFLIDNDHQLRWAEYCL